MSNAKRICSAIVILVTLLKMTGARMVDMTHYLNKNARHYQTFRGFELTVAVNSTLYAGHEDSRFKLLSKDVAMSEHTGTHMDAPVHTFTTGKYLHEITVDKLMGPAVVFDLTEKAKTDPDYALSLDDIKEHEEKYGEIEEGSILLLDSGGADVYDDINRYYGTPTPEDLKSMHFPGFGGPAVKWLIEERKIRGIGTDRMSFDVGNSVQFPVHYETSSKEIWGLENVNRVKELPPRGATVIVMPILLEYGTGGPVRMVAFLDKTDLDFLSSGTFSLKGNVCTGILVVVLMMKYYVS